MNRRIEAFENWGYESFSYQYGYGMFPYPKDKHEILFAIGSDISEPRDGLIVIKTAKGDIKYTYHNEWFRSDGLKPCTPEILQNLLDEKKKAAKPRTASVLVWREKEVQEFIDELSKSQATERVPDRTDGVVT